jgi:predicted permease
LLAWWLLRALPAIAPATLARLVDVQFDIASLLFAAVTALAIGLVVGLLPAWQLPSANLRQLSAGGRVGKHAVSAEAFRRGLVVVQVSLAVVLLVGAALLGRTMMALTSVHPGFVGAHALTFQVGLPDDIFSQPERQTAYFDQLMARVRQHPSVVGAGVSSTLPLNQVGFSGSFGIEGRPRPLPPEPWPSAHKIAITTGYLEAIGTRVVRGRGITAADSAESEPVALIDEALARTYFPGEDPIGRRLDYFRKMWRIVGVVEEIKQRSVKVEAYPAMYMPAPQLPAVAAFNRLTGGVAVRATGEAMDLVPFIRTAMKEVDTTVPMYAVSGLDTRLSETFAEPRFFALALGLFATLAVTVSVLGVFGVLSYAVERRQVEFGVRRALGGDTSHIMALVVRQAAFIVSAGLAVGLGVAVVGTGLLRTLLFGVEQLDAATFAGAACVIGLVGIAAAALPAWRAMQVDPARALRAD